MDIELHENPVLSFEWYEDDLPDWIEPQLDTIYQNNFSTLAYLRISNIDFHPSAFVIRSGCKPIEIFIFTRTRNRINVHSWVARITARNTTLFAAQAFARYPTAHIIAFAPMDTPLAEIGATSSPFPFQASPVLEDIVTTLPTTVEDYWRQLGKSTKHAMKGRLGKIRKEYPSFSYDVRSQHEVAAARINEIVTYQRRRWQSQGKMSSVDCDYVSRTTSLAQHYGLVGVARIGDEFAAGQIAFVVGDHCYLEMTAHNEKYNKLSIGRIGIYCLICECIERGIKEFHFLWGDQDFKFRMGGIERELVALTVYRSRLQILFNLPVYLNQSIVCSKRRIKQRLKRRARKYPALRRWFGYCRRSLLATRGADGHI